MANDRNSIFDLERRIPFSEDFTYLLVDLKSSKLHSIPYGYGKNIVALLDAVITDWPWRRGTINIEHYARKYGFYQEAIFLPFFKGEEYYGDEEIDEQKSLYLLELIVNLLFWIPEYFVNIGFFSPYDEMAKEQVLSELVYYFDSIDDLLEGMNLQIKSINDEGTKRFVLVKRDADVDSVLEIVPDLAYSLLSYNDFRNRDNLKAKKAILFEIANYLEPLRDTFSGTPYSSLADTCFFAFNNLSIRHNNGNQVPLSDEEQLDVYNKVFLMTIQLIRVSKVKEFQIDIDGYKP